MLSSNASYPYPLLRVVAEDYAHAVFHDDLEVLRENQGFRIVPRFSVENEQIEELIRNDVFSYAIQIQCKSTYFRTVEYVKDNTAIFLPSGQVHETVELCPCIIVMQDLTNYVCDDFVPAFKASPVTVYKNDIVGIGNITRFRAYYKADEVKKASSVITVKKNDAIESLKVDLTQSNIVVELPPDQFEFYLDVGRSTTDQVTLLTGIISVPAITMALGVMDIDDDNDYSDYAWYKSLRTVLDKMADGDFSKVELFLEDPFGTAQKMLGGNVSVSLGILKERDW